MFVEVGSHRLRGHQSRVDAQGNVLVLVQTLAVSELDFEDTTGEVVADRPDEARCHGLPVHATLPTCFDFELPDFPIPASPRTTNTPL